MYHKPDSLVPGVIGQIYLNKWLLEFHVVNLCFKCFSQWVLTIQKKLYTSVVYLRLLHHNCIICDYHCVITFQ